VTSSRSHAFTFPHTFFRESANEVIPELQASGFTGVNLALNYHASRDFLLRQGPQLEYLSDGFHYYKPNLTKYESGALLPDEQDHLIDNVMLDSVISSARAHSFSVNAWAVFLHNSALGKRHPLSTVTNVFGNHFLSELCPSSPAVAGYVRGLAADLCSRGISSLVIESLHFHGARHGEHHERFFMELSPVTEFLFSLCFCPSCCERFAKRGGDPEALKLKVAIALKAFLHEGDSWLGIPITQAFLADAIGPEILNYLRTREETVAFLYRDVTKIAHDLQVATRLVDQSPLIDLEESSPLNLSWLVGIDPQQVIEHIDFYEPLIYRNSLSEAKNVARSYSEFAPGKVIGILRPTYPDNDSAENLKEKVAALRECGISDIDFYLLDVMRPRDLQWIKESL
jgi:hypothetical protein